MHYTLISLLAILSYLAAGFLLWRRLSGKTPAGKSLPLTLALLGTAMHMLILSENIFTPNGINFGFFHALSLLSGLIALLFLITAFSKPVENLGIVILPLAALAILLEHGIPTQHFLPANEKHLEIHILLSIVAYSLLSIAALQAMLLSIQDRHLHNKHPGGLIRALPPLQTMETLLFQMLTLGFVLQSLSLITGAIYIDNLLTQHLVHKTVLSILAWGVYATLLWGRWRYGWRGKTAIRWTLGGFISLAFAYLGSKLVLEIILGY